MEAEHIEVPEDFRLLPGERIINVEVFNHPPATELQAPSGLRELYRLARVRLDESISKFNTPLASLALETEDSTSPDLHRYEALFGRDSLRVAMDLLPLFPQLAHATIIELARYQGEVFCANREEEPGRIPHEIRDASDPIANGLTETLGWGWPFYGTVDATPEFVRTMVAYMQRTFINPSVFLAEKYTTHTGAERTMKEAFDNAIEWMLRRMGQNPEGFIESKLAFPESIANQVWKDSWDSYSHEDGTIANLNNGVASVEVQRVAYDALIDAAEVYELLGDGEAAKKILVRAEQLKEAIFTHLWTSDKGGYFVLGTDRSDDGSLRPLKVRTSNMGHLLGSRLLEGEKGRQYREAVVRHLFSAEMLTPSGIRTLASDEARYRPGAYHNGSVWLWDTHFIIRGLRRHGYNQLATVLSEQLFTVIEETRTFPEFVRGDDSPRPALNNRIVDVWDENERRENRVEQPPQQVQAWSVASILALQHYNIRHRNVPSDMPGEFERDVLDQIGRE